MSQPFNQFFQNGVNVTYEEDDHLLYIDGDYIQCGKEKGADPASSMNLNDVSMVLHNGPFGCIIVGRESDPDTFECIQFFTSSKENAKYIIMMLHGLMYHHRKTTTV